MKIILKGVMRVSGVYRGPRGSAGCEVRRLNADKLDGKDSTH